MLKKLKQRNEGFTIIEVLIVLAIGGLIMLIVFLAVPALQRTQRNNARKSDVARLGGAATEFVSNNNGTLPTNTNAATIYASAGSLSQYVAANFSVAAGAGAGVTNLTTVQLRTGAKCNAGNAVGGSPKQMAILYAVETTGTPTPVCQDV